MKIFLTTLSQRFDRAMEFPSAFFVLCMAVLVSVTFTCHKVAAADYDVTSYGAVGDGTTDDNGAFSKAWTAACADASGATFIIPSAKTFLVSPITFKGPCASIKVQVDGNLVAPQKGQWGAASDNSAWIQFQGINGLIVDGTGQFDGQGTSWWGQGGGRPKSLSFTGCDNLKLSGISSRDPPRAHISIVSSSGIDISNINLNAPEDSPNTDGIDISDGQNNQIHDSNIGTGDDCIAVGTGISSLNITNVSCGPGHGISIGSLGENGQTAMVENVQVSHCTFTGTQNAARIKTWQGGAGYARSISFSDITLNGAQNPIIIDQYYSDADGVEDAGGAVEVSGVTYDGFTGTSSSDVAVTLKCSTSVGCTGITLSNINMASAQGHSLSATCINAHGTSSATSPAVTCLLP